MNALRKYLPLACLVLCAVLVLLLLIDLIWPGLYIFLKPFGKWFALITCLCASGCGMLQIARDRETRRRAARSARPTRRDARAHRQPREAWDDGYRPRR